MADDVWSRLGITPYEADPSKVKLKLGDDSKPTPKSSQKLPDNIYTHDGFIPDVLRTIGENALNYANVGSAALNAMGTNIDRSKLTDTIGRLEQAQNESDNRILSPTRSAEVAKINAQLANAHGVVDTIKAGGEAGLDMLMHPIDNAGKIVGSLVDPLNAFGFGAGDITAKLAAKMGSNRLARTAAAATAGAVTNAPVNAVQEGSFAAAKGEDWQKAALAGAGGGAVGGAVLGSIPGIVSSPRFSPNKVAPIVADHIGTHEANYDALMQNSLMQTPDSEKFDPNIDIGFKREPSVTDHPSDTLPPIDHNAVFGSVMGEHLDSARAEGNEVYSKAMELAQNPKSKPEHIKAFIDNAITPTHDDLSISDLVNNGDPLPSRYSGMRIVDTLERNIRIAEANPTDAKTNIDLSNILKKEGFSKELNNVYTKAYSAKDPTILTDYIMTKTQPLAEDIRTQIDDHLGGYKARSDEQKALRWVEAIPEDAHDLVAHPQFLDHLSERESVSAEDARYPQTRTADLVLSHENNGDGYETVVQQPAQFDRNHAYDFEMTKKDVANIRAGRWNDALVQKLRNDLDRRDNDPLYNPEKNSETLLNNSVSLSPTEKLYHEMSDSMGADHADFNIGLIEGRAKAMGITPDELIVNHPLIVRDMRDMHGSDYIDAIREAEINRLFQAVKHDAPFEEKLSEIRSILKDKVKREKLNTEEKELYDFAMSNKSSVSFIRDGIRTLLSKGDDKSGFKHIIIRHYGDGADSALSVWDILRIGKTIIEGSPITDTEIARNKDVFGSSKAAVRRMITVNDKKMMYVVGLGKDETGGNSVITYYKSLVKDGSTSMDDSPKAPIADSSEAAGGYSDHRSQTVYDKSVHQNGDNVKPSLKSMSDTAILKDMTSIPRAIEEGKIDATTDRNQPGWMSQAEIEASAEAIRKSTPYMEGGARVYEYRNDHGDTFRIIADREGFRMHSDRAAGEGKELGSYRYDPIHEDAKRLNQKIPDVKLTEDQINGMIELGVTKSGDQKAIITLFKTADASTLPHELMHWMEKTLTDVERAAVDDILKHIPDGTPRSEALARMFEKYLAEGEAPTPELKGAFEKFRDWLTRLWETLAHDKNRDFELTDAHRELYRALLGDREAAAKLSERYDGIMNDKMRAEADRISKNENTPDVLFQRIIKDSEQPDKKTYTSTKNILEKMIDTIGEKIENGADMLPDGIRPWLHPTKAQKLFAEYQSAMREESARIWEQAREIKDYLEKNTVSENSSRDLVRALGGDMDPSKLSEELQPLYAQMRKVIDANAQALIDAGALDEKHSINDYLKRYYEKHEKELGFFKKSLSMGKKFARKDLTHDERLALGMIEDASLVIPNTLAEQRIQLMQARVLKQIAEDFALDEPHEGYARISDESVSHNGSVKKYGALAGKYVPMELKEAMTDMGR
ncbi:MAG: hypothetical protein PHO52_11175, partial [Sulfuricurvum sp.]